MKVKSICGVILASDNPQALAQFYSDVFDVPFEKEEHGDLAPHYGVDIGEVHLGIHPPQNLGMNSVGHSSISIAYNVDCLEHIITKLTAMNTELVIPVHDEGFGNVATYKDPDGNHFEIVELNYDFNAKD